MRRHVLYGGKSRAHFGVKLRVVCEPSFATDFVEPKVQNIFG